MPQSATIHACAILIGTDALLIRGPAGSGKSQLTLDLIQASQNGLLRFARLVADDRVRIEACHGRVLVRPAPALGGMIEVRGLGIRQLPYEPVAVVGCVVDLAVADAQRLPSPADCVTVVAGVHLARIAVAAGEPPLPIVLSALTTSAAALPIDD